MVNKGLLDSGATHPLRAKRKGERLHHLPKVKVTLAGDKEIYMALTPTGVIVGEEGAEPIVPMGLQSLDVRFHGSQKVFRWCTQYLASWRWWLKLDNVQWYHRPRP